MASKSLIGVGRGRALLIALICTAVFALSGAVASSAFAGTVSLSKSTGLNAEGESLEVTLSGMASEKSYYVFHCGDVGAFNPSAPETVLCDWEGGHWTTVMTDAEGAATVESLTVYGSFTGAHYPGAPNSTEIECKEVGGSQCGVVAFPVDHTTNYGIANTS